MYANAPHASAATTPLSPLPQQPPAAQHGLPQGMPPAVHGGSYGMQHAAGVQQASAAPAASPRAGAMFVTGAYEASGDPAIDRMRRLEAACKRYGSPL